MWTQVAIWGTAAVLVLVTLFSSKLISWAKSAMSGAGGTAPSTRAAQLQRLADCADWFEAAGCKEGLDLIAQATPHAMHEHKGPIA